MTRILLALAALALVAAPAHAQYASYGDPIGYGSSGYLAAGRAESNDELLDGRWSFAGAYESRYGASTGPMVGLRLAGGYWQFRPDVEAYLDSLGASGGRAEGGSAHVFDTGVDVMYGLQASGVSVYGFYGWRYFREYRREMTLETATDEYQFGGRTEAAVGNASGYGVRLRVGDAGALVAERYRGGGDDGIMRLRSWRFGVAWGH